MPSRLPRWMETIENIHCLSPDEKVLFNERRVNNRLNLLQREQMTVAFMKDIFYRIYNPEDYVFYPFARYDTTRRACMLLPIHHG